MASTEEFFKDAPNPPDAPPRLVALRHQWEGSNSLAAAQAYINGLVFELDAERMWQNRSLLLADFKRRMEEAEHRADESAARAFALNQQVVKLLAHCPDTECPECSRIICPHKDPQHFHHAGCPSCGKEAA